MAVDPRFTWRSFVRNVRNSGDLLRTLPRWRDPVLVSGCQRSGTTMISRLIRMMPDFGDFNRHDDDELEGAMVLAGQWPFESSKRLCFQTTYLNAQFPQYFKHSNYRLVWVLRNPYSAIYSLLRNWDRYAFQDLFDTCGSQEYNDLEENKGIRHRKLYRACASYIGKNKQVYALSNELPSHRLKVVDYDYFVRQKQETVPAIMNFISATATPEMLVSIRSDSRLKHLRMSVSQRQIIERNCMPFYQKLLDSFSLETSVMTSLNEI